MGAVPQGLLKSVGPVMPLSPASVNSMTEKAAMRIPIAAVALAMRIGMVPIIVLALRVLASTMMVAWAIRRVAEHFVMVRLPRGFARMERGTLKTHAVPTIAAPMLV